MDQAQAIWNDVSAGSASVLEWLSLRLGLGEVPSLWLALSALAVVAVLVGIPVLWISARYPVTIVHEMGHVIMARLCGRSVSGIRLHTDTSGLAVTRGAPHGLGMALTSMAGYLAPGAIGLVCVWAAMSARAGFALVGVLGLLLAALLLVRNVWGLAVVVACLIGAIATVQSVNPVLVTGVVLVLGFLLVMGSVRAVIELCLLHRRGEAADSDAFGAASAVKGLIPATVWLGIFTLGTGACAVTSLWIAGSVILMPA